MFNDLPQPIVVKPWYRRRWFVIIVLMVVAWFGLPLLLGVFIPTPNATLGFTAAPGVSTATNNPVVVDVVTTDDPSRGLSVAPIMIVEFGDFQCPFSRQAHPIIKQVLSKYPEVVRFMYRDFPISQINPEAIAAAEAANCANQQGKFWQAYDQLYENQDTLGANFYNALGASLGLDSFKYQRCRDNHQTLSEIEDDFKAGVAAGVGGTPTFFVNGRKVQGALTLDLWDKVIASELARKFKR